MLTSLSFDELLQMIDVLCYSQSPWTSQYSHYSSKWTMDPDPLIAWKIGKNSGFITFNIYLHPNPGTLLVSTIPKTQSDFCGARIRKTTVRFHKFV